MKFLFSELKILPLASITEKFAKIPLHEDELWIDGDFRKISYFEHSFLGEALMMLPLHIKSIKFSGKFQYDYYQLCPAIAGSYYRSMGAYLADFVPYIPAHVYDIKFKFLPNYAFERSVTPYTSSVSKELVTIFQSLPASITSLDLNEIIFTEPAESLGIQKMYLSIPKTVKQVKMHQFTLSDYPLEQRQKIFEYFSGFIKHLSLANLDILKNENFDYVRSIFNGLGDGLESLDLSFNRLYDAHPTKVKTLFANIPKSLKHLSLCGNLIAQLRDLNSIVTSLPRNLQSLDVAENEVLDLKEEEFTQFFKHFGKLSRLRLFERVRPGFWFYRHQTNYALLPNTVNTLVISEIEAKELEFIQAGGLRYLPAHVHTLDLSDNQLFLYEAADLSYFLGCIAPFITKLILANNKLSSISGHELKLAIEGIDPHIEEIALYGNGLDRMPYSTLKSYLGLLPDRIYDFSQDKLSLSHAGKIRGFLLRTPNLYFQPMTRVRRQSEWAYFFLVMSQLLQQKQLTPKLLMKVCEFACDPMGQSPKTQQALTSMFHKASHVKGLHHHITPTDLLKSMRIRFNLARGGRIDLSHCGLHHLQHASDFQALYAMIPIEVQILNLRGNHFKQHPSSFKAFLDGLKFLPSHIRFLDLGANGFEGSSLEDLKTQFAFLPSTITHLDLGDERAVSLKDCIQRQIYPQHYHQLMKQCHSIDDKLKLLLLDYSQANSRFKRFIYGYWNRQHIPEVNRLFIWMAHGYLFHIQDILEHLNGIQMINDSGSLAKISHFIHTEVNKPQEKIQVKVLA